MPLNPITVNDFSGGITDFIKGSKKHQYTDADNFLIDRNKKPFTRPGSVVFDPANSRPVTNQRISSLWNFDENVALFAGSIKQMFRYSAGWPELQGPAGFAYFDKGLDNSIVTGSMWKGHLFLTNDAQPRPMKTFRTLSGTFKSVTAGLPKYTTPLFYDNALATAAIVTLANDIRTQLLDHFADATRHPVATDTVSAAMITAPALIIGDTLATTITLVTQLMAAYMNHYTDLATAKGSRLYHSNSLDTEFAIKPNFRLDTLETPTDFLGVAQILNDLKLKYNWHLRSFLGHPSVGPDVVTAADLASTSETPTFSDISFTTLIDFANNLKKKFNDHIAGTNGTHGHLPPTVNLTSTLNSDFSGPVDTTNTINLADATDRKTLIELVAHIWAAYQNHHDDSGKEIFDVLGTTDHATTNLIYNVTPLTASLAAGAIDNLKVGMFLGFTTSLNAWVMGRKIQSINTATGQITMDANHNSAGGNPDVGLLHAFSFRKWHAMAIGGVPVEADYTNALLNSNLSPELMLSDDGAILTLLLDLGLKYNKHDLSGLPLGAPGIGHSLHLYGNTSQLTYDSTLENKRYNYAFVFSYTYKTITNETFIDKSTPLFTTKVVLKSIEDEPSKITNLGQVVNNIFENGAYHNDGNYDVSNIKVEIYRTKESSLVYKKVGEVANGVTTFTDAMPDTLLDAQETLYTQGGVLDNDPPPRAKFMHITQDGKAYYGYITRTLADTSFETIPQRVEQAVIDDPDSVPAGNFIDFPIAVKGVSSVRTIPIVWTEEATYRLEGTYNELGQGIIERVTVSDRIGLAGSGSPVQVDGAVVFAGSDQMYMTDGYHIIPLGRTWPTTYANLISTTDKANRIQGAFDKLNNRVWYGACLSASENNSAYIADMNYPVTEEIGLPWTTASNGSHFAPTALCFFNGDLIRGDSRGYIFKHNSQYTSDPRVDTAVAATTWASKYLPYKLKSVSLNFESDAVRKWASIIECKFENIANLSVQINGYNDIGRTSGACAPIRVRNPTSQIDERRYFPSGSLYFTDKQIEFVPAFVIISTSDDFAEATINNIAKTVTINSGTFSDDQEDLYIYFEHDSYTEGFLITAENAGNTILTVSDALNHLPANGSYAWVIRGFPKTERMALAEYTVWGQGMGVNQTTAALEGGTTP